MGSEIAIAILLIIGLLVLLALGLEIAMTATVRNPHTPWESRGWTRAVLIFMATAR